MSTSGSGNNNYIYNWEMMFDKVLTPTDVGKQYRLLIPRQYAEDYFPYFPLENGEEEELEFTDRNGKVWTFRYFKTNVSYTIGWRIFLKEKKLVAGDTISFHRAYIPDDNAPERRRRIMLIDWSYGIFSPFYRSQFQGREDLGLGVIGESHNAGSPLNLGRSESFVNSSEPSQPSTTKKMRLFGVDIEESSSGETSGQMGFICCSSLSQAVIRDNGQSSGRSLSGEMGASSLLSPAVIRDDGQSSGRSPSGEMGASSSSFKQLNDDEDRKRKEKSLAF